MIQTFPQTKSWMLWDIQMKLWPWLHQTCNWRMNWVHKNSYWERPLGPPWHTAGNHWGTQCAGWSGKKENIGRMCGKTTPAASGSCYLAPPASPGSRGLQRRDAGPPGITPGNVCQPYARPAAGSSAGGKEWLQCWVQTERHCHVRLHSGWQLSWRQAGSNPGHGELGIQAHSPLVPRLIILMSNISPFDKSWASEQKMWLRGMTRSDASGN